MLLHVLTPSQVCTTLLGPETPHLQAEIAQGLVDSLEVHNLHAVAVGQQTQSAPITHADPNVHALAIRTSQYMNLSYANSSS
jgi:hypothetical protein